jgi:hypothetical protein
MSKGAILKSLSHPLLLLIVGAIITSLIIPNFTRQWQDHQKELELKTNLVSEISDAVASLLAKTQITKVIVSTPYKELHDAYEIWESASAVIESKLEAYFSDSSLPQLWSNYSAILGDFAFLSISDDTCRRANYVDNIRNYLLTDLEPINNTGVNDCTDTHAGFNKIYRTPYTSNLENIDWSDLVEYGNQTEMSDSWQLLKQGMVYQKDRLIQEILGSHIPAFS